MEQANASVSPPGPSPEEYAQAAEWFAQDIDEHYTDTLNVAMGPYGLTLTFGIRGAGSAGNLRPRPNTRVHMSHSLAIVLERLLRRILTTYEMDAGQRVLLEPEVLESLGLSDKDMQDLERLHRARFVKRRRADRELE